MTTYKVEFGAIICSPCLGSHPETSGQVDGKYWERGALVKLNAEDAASLLAQGAVSVVASEAPESPKEEPVAVKAPEPAPEPEKAPEPVLEAPEPEAPVLRRRR